MKRCSRCSKPLTRRQIRERNACCSRACGNGWKHGQNEIEAVLAILDGQGEWFLTASDLSIWRYGSDDPHDVHAVQQTLYHLKRRGVLIETRPMPELSRARSVVIGYRLAQARKEHAA